MNCCKQDFQHCRLETLPALLGHITLKGTDYMVNWKLLGKKSYVFKSNGISSMTFIVSTDNWSL